MEKKEDSDFISSTEEFSFNRKRQYFFAGFLRKHPRLSVKVLFWGIHGDTGSLAGVLRFHLWLDAISHKDGRHAAHAQDEEDEHDKDGED